MRIGSSTLRMFFVLYLLGVILTYGSLFWQTRKMIAKGYPDLAIYYCAGRVVRDGQADKFYDHATIFPVEEQFAAAVPQFRGPLPYTHPPFEALLFVPFSYLSFQNAYIAWDLMNVGLLIASALMLRRYLPALRDTLSPAVWAMIALAFFPPIFGLLQAQDAILLLFLYALVFVDLENNRLARSGVWLGLGLFKFHLVFPFVLLLLVQKKVRVLYGFVPTAAVLGVISIAMVGVKGILAYPSYVLQVENELTATEFVPAGMPSFRGLLYIALGERPFVAPLLGLLCVALFLFAAWKCRSVLPDSNHMKFCLSLLVTSLIGYHVVSYDLSMLLLCVLVLANDLIAKKWHRNAWLMVLALTPFFVPPLNLFLSMQWKQYGLMALALLACVWGIAREMSRRTAMLSPSH